jgi:phage shock protein A
MICSPTLSGRPGAILVDKTIALILGAIGSAAIAAAFAGGIALIGKVAETGEQLEKGRTERTQQYGNITKDISIIETKISQLSVQITQMETRLERMMEHDFQNRDKRMDDITAELSRLREQIMSIPRDERYPRTRK